MGKPGMRGGDPSGARLSKRCPGSGHMISVIECGRGLAGLGGFAGVGFLVLPEIVHVEVAAGSRRLLGLARGAGRPRHWEDAHDVGPAFDLLVEPFEHVCALEMLMMLARQAVEGEGFFDRFPDSADELLITVAPFGEPG
jgi:hypothetical protein